MPTIHDLKLEVLTDPLHDGAILRVSCEVTFTNFEVKATEKLKLRYRAQCRVYAKDLWYAEPVAVLDDQELPQPLESRVSATEHLEFSSVRERSNLHIHLFTEDQLFAEVTLQNEQTGETIVSRSESFAVDLT